VLILVLGLRKGEVLGLTWELVNLAAELYVGEQVQRVGNELLRRQVKTETSEAPLPFRNRTRPRSSSATLSKKPTASGPLADGWIRGWYSSPGTAPRWSRGTSAAALTAA
jgi:hypothetical protein